MRDLNSEGIVLARRPKGELDLRIVVFTKQFGKLVAKAKSGLKILSKLSPHLDVGDLVRVRLVEKNDLHIADALKERKIRELVPADFHFLDMMLPEGEPEQELWNLLVGGNFTWREALKILGWDPEAAVCIHCGGKPYFFEVRTQDFFCRESIRNGGAASLIAIA